MFNNSICIMCSHFVNKVCTVDGLTDEDIIYDDITNKVADCPMFNHYLDNGHLPNYFDEF